MSDIYLQITETPAVVTLSAPVISAALSSTVTVANVVSVNVVTMPAINVTAAVSGGLSNAELRASAVSVAVTTMPAISISSVTVSNFPASQTVAGTVTIGSCVTHGVNVANSVTISSLPAISGTVTIGAGTAQIGSVTASISGTSTITGSVSILNYPATQPVSIASLPSLASGANQIGSVTASISNSVTISSLPAISGTVTANTYNSIEFFYMPTFRTSRSGGDCGGYFQRVNQNKWQCGNFSEAGIGIQSFNYVGGIQQWVYRIDDGDGGADIFYYEGSNSLYPSASGIVITLNGYSITSGGPSILYTRPDTQPISGTVTVGNSVTVSSLPAISGTVTANNPSGALTTRFGSVTTANTSQITTAVTNTSRKYLLAQNISTGTVTIGIGFSPTTTQGIQLTAGSGLTFDSFVPTGAVYWLGATTGAAYTILEG